MGDALTAYGHYLGIMVMFSALLGEHLLLGGALDRESVRRIVITDRVYAGSAALVLISGITRLALFGKGVAFYAGSALFHVKIGMFVVLVLLSIYPTVQFLSWRAATSHDDAASVPADRQRSLRRIINVELAIMGLIPLIAVLMGRGFGY